MINKFQSFSGKKVITSLGDTCIMLVYDLLKTNCFPSYVHYDGDFFSFKCSFIKDNEFLVVYIVNDLDMKQILDYGSKNNIPLYIEYVNE